MRNINRKRIYNWIFSRTICAKNYFKNFYFKKMWNSSSSLLNFQTNLTFAFQTMVLSTWLRKATHKIRKHHLLPFGINSHNEQSLCLIQIYPYCFICLARKIETTGTIAGALGWSAILPQCVSLEKLMRILACAVTPSRNTKQPKISANFLMVIYL